MKNSVMVALATLLGWSTLARADRPEEAVPLIRFYDSDRHQHLYTTIEPEIAGWRQASQVKEHGSLGYVSLKELPGTIRIWRAIRTKDRRHFYYAHASGKLVDVLVDNKHFAVYAWKNPGDGRVPVYGSTWTDGGDVFFDLKRDAVRKFSENSKKALGVDRKLLGNGPIFYVYPMAEGDESAIPSNK